MVKRAKAIEVDGRTYHPEFPPSEQNDVEKITKRFKNKTPAQAADVAHRRGTAQLCQGVPPLKHEEEIKEWDVGDFFKLKEHDERDDSIPVDAGPPQETKDEFERLRKAEANTPKPRGRQHRRRSGADNDESNEGHSENDAKSERRGKGDDSKDRSAAAAKPSAARSDLLPRVSRGNGRTVDPMQELDDVLRSIQEVSADLSHLSNEADERDVYKKLLSDLAQQLDTGLERAQQAKETIVKRLRERPALFHNSLGLLGDVKKRGRQGLEEASEEQQIRAKRNQAVASLATRKANQNATAQPPSLLQEPGPVSPYYHGPYLGYGGNTSGAAAFQSPQRFHPSPPTMRTTGHSHAGRHHQNPGFDTPSRHSSQHHSVNTSNWFHTPGRTPDQHRTTVNTPGGTLSAHPSFAAPSHSWQSLPVMHAPSVRSQPAGYPSNYNHQGFLSSPLAHQTHGPSYHHNPSHGKKEHMVGPAAAAPTQNSEPAGYASHPRSNYDHEGFPSSPFPSSPLAPPPNP